MAPILVQEVDEQPSTSTALELTPVEATLRRLLLDVAGYIDDSPPPQGGNALVKLPEELSKQKLVLRFTGGWVRDKLLGVTSHDIDVAINKMTGYQFGLKMKEYLESPGNPEKYGLEGVATTDKQRQKTGTTDKSKTVGGLHKIEANPEKSKHLETVTTKILGLDVDLVNLRKETYTEDSRNPAMEFGTPEEDALRRDATVNAMFYNLNTRQIEDFTGQGHDDLRNKVIRTPLEPCQTFKDDPLRVLRLIRFASRLGYTIEPSALKAMQDGDIKDALRRKISRERVGKEVEKALRGPDPREAMRLIFNLDLYETIFSDPAVDAADYYKPDPEARQPIIDFLQDTLDANGTLAQLLVRDEDEKFLAWQLAALVPYRDAPQPDAPAPGRRAPPPVAATVAREGIKATNKVCDVITAAVRNQSEISNLLDKLHEQKRWPNKRIKGDDASARDLLGMAIRRWGASWRSQVLYSLLVEAASNPEATGAIERKYDTFMRHLRDLGILEAYQMKPLLDGKALAKALGTPPGPWMKDALDVVMAWQLRNPASEDAQAAIEGVKNHQEHGELTSDLVSHFLKLTIRPLFAKAKPSSVTEQGRKNTTAVLPPKLTSESMDDAVIKPWKSEKDGYALGLLAWVVRSLDHHTLEQVWPLVVPPLLTLIDDWETNNKTLGVQLLQSLLHVTPPSLLERTGLGEVFEEALMPCLSYLPTITPEDESIALLSALYPALLSLSRVRYPKDLFPSSQRSATMLDRERAKFLDAIIRKGVIYGYSHCRHYPGIVVVLLDTLVLLLNELGIQSVKHLKYILPMLTETLSHPLGVANVPALTSAVKAMQGVILNGWPRVVEHRGEVLKALTLCWLKMQEVDTEAVQRLRQDTQETVRMLKAAMGDQGDFDADCAMLVGADERLKGPLDAE